MMGQFHNQKTQVHHDSMMQEQSQTSHFLSKDQGSNQKDRRTSWPVTFFWRAREFVHFLFFNFFHTVRTIVRTISSMMMTMMY